MTTLTLEEQKKLAENVLPEFTWITNVTCNTVVDEDEVCPYIFWPIIDGHDYERSQALAVLEAYAKSAPTDAYSENRCTAAAYRILLALRTGDLDPIARELIND